MLDPDWVARRQGAVQWCVVVGTYESRWDCSWSGGGATTAAEALASYARSAAVGSPAGDVPPHWPQP